MSMSEGSRIGVGGGYVSSAGAVSSSSGASARVAVVGGNKVSKTVAVASPRSPQSGAHNNDVAERICAKRLSSSNDGGFEYLVKWLGKPMKAATWIAESDAEQWRAEIYKFELEEVMDSIGGDNLKVEANVVAANEQNIVKESKSNEVIVLGDSDDELQVETTKRPREEEEDDDEVRVEKKGGDEKEQNVIAVNDDGDDDDDDDDEDYKGEEEEEKKSLPEKTMQQILDSLAQAREAGDYLAQVEKKRAKTSVDPVVVRGPSAEAQSPKVPKISFTLSKPPAASPNVVAPEALSLPSPEAVLQVDGGSNPVSAAAVNTSSGSLPDTFKLPFAAVVVPPLVGQAPVASSGTRSRPFPAKPAAASRSNNSTSAKPAASFANPPVSASSPVHVVDADDEVDLSQQMLSDAGVLPVWGVNNPTQIEGARKIAGVIEYLVSWEQSEVPTWEPSRLVRRHASGLLLDYFESKARFPYEMEDKDQ